MSDLVKCQDRVITPYGQGVVVEVTDSRIVVAHDTLVYGGSNSRTAQDFRQSYSVDQISVLVNEEGEQ